MNIVAQLEFELSNYDIVVQNDSLYVTGLTLSTWHSG